MLLKTDTTAMYTLRKNKSCIPAKIQNQKEKKYTFQHLHLKKTTTFVPFVPLCAIFPTPPKKNLFFFKTHIVSECVNAGQY